MTPQHLDVNKLINRNPLLNRSDMLYQVSKLRRMERFYNDKKQIAPKAQATMFEGFVDALVYASTIIEMYDDLTRILSNYAEDDPASGKQDKIN